MKGNQLSVFNRRDDELMRRNREALDRNAEALERMTAALDHLERRFESTMSGMRVAGRQANAPGSVSEAEREEGKIRRRELVERAEGAPRARAA